MHCNTGGGVITNEMFVVVVVGDDDTCDRQHCDSGGGGGGGAPGRHQTRDSDVIDHVSSNHFLQQKYKWSKNSDERLHRKGHPPRPRGNPGPHLIHGFLGPARVHPKRHLSNSIDSCVSAQLIVMSN